MSWRAKIGILVRNFRGLPGRYMIEGANAVVTPLSMSLRKNDINTELESGTKYEVVILSQIKDFDILILNLKITSGQ